MKYTLLWKKKPNEIHTNLYRAIAADSYWWYATNPLLDNTFPVGSTQSQLLIVAADLCFAKAIALNPNAPDVNKAYGYFKFFRREQMPEGLVMLRKAEGLSPDDPQVHSMLGEVYSNPTGAAYNPKAAEDELKVAINIDSHYASPHNLLANLYIDLKRNKEAQNELSKYLSLAPAGTASTKIVKFMETQITHGQ